MTADLYVWSTPRDPDRVAGLVDAWQAAGGDPATSPFDPSTDVGWFARELVEDLPDLDVVTDAVPSGSRAPIWLGTGQEQPARVVAVTLPPDDPRGAMEALEVIGGLAAKYDLVLYDPRNRRVQEPLAAMAAEASATFWPGGAIQAGLAGAAGAALAVGAWIVDAPILSGALVVVGAFLVAMTVLTFVHEARVRMRRDPGAGTGDPRR